MKSKNLLFTDGTCDNWFHNKYYACGGNDRYSTFHLVLNILYQKRLNPVIIETGCQREANDFGAGMSTSIFAEYIDNYGGCLISIDNNKEHLRRCAIFLKDFIEKKTNIHLILGNSISYLEKYSGACDLLYLDSLDYPVGESANDSTKQLESQLHSLKEFQAIEDRLSKKAIILIDDNRLPGGGKPFLLKDYLYRKKWICLLDHTQTVWIREL